MKYRREGFHGCIPPEENDNVLELEEAEEFTERDFIMNVARK